MQSKNNLKALFLSFVALGLVSTTSLSFAEKEKNEKCMGLAKKGMGDGKAMIDGKVQEWLFVPAGACAKFVGGRIYIDKNTKTK